MVAAVAPKHMFTYDGARVSVYHADTGQGLPSHAHVYAHAIMCNAGICLVTLEGRSYTMTKVSKPLNLPANEWHEIEAVENGTVFVNIFSEEKN